MQIIIIAGGDGSRMQPLSTHKSLIPFRGTSILTYTLQDISIFKASKIIIVASPTAYEETLTIASQFGAIVVKQSKPLGMADAILCARSHLDLNDSTLVIDGCTLRDSASYTHILKSIQSDNRNIWLSGMKVSVYKPGGYFTFHGENITGVVEKPGPDNMPSPYYKQVLDYYPDTKLLLSTWESASSNQDDVYEVALSSLIKIHHAHLVELTGYHSSLKHAPRLLDVMKCVLKYRLAPGIHKTASVAKTAIIDSNVEIAKGAKVLDYAIIKGPAYIGENTIVGNGALVRESIVENDCQVGYGSEIARSYLGPATKGHMMYVGDSVIEGQVNLSAGTVLANYRFDHKEVIVDLPIGKFNSGRTKLGSIIAKNVITGVNTSLMPGSVIGKNSTIGSGCVIKGLVPDGTYIKPSYSQVENDK